MIEQGTGYKFSVFWKMYVRGQGHRIFRNVTLSKKQHALVCRS